jgi:hypothetical protein
MNYLTEDPKWVSFYPQFNSSFYVEKAGYFDERPQVHTSVTQLIALACLPLAFISAWFLLLIPFVFFGWGTLYINLPIKTGIQDCDSAAWGFNYHNNIIWIYIGGGGNFEGGKKWKTFHMPWDMDWVRTTTFLKDGSEFHETKGSPTKWQGDGYGTYDWLNKEKWQETYPYIDSYDNTTVNATISVEEREWRPRGARWTSLFAKIRKNIHVEFDNEVGKEKGSYKGGTLGCGYEMKPNETPLECLKRMEKERKF